MASFSGGDALKKKLEDIAKKMAKGDVEVGFIDHATYTDGTSVAAVAFNNEYGNSKQQPRPFFRNMISKESPGWGDKMARLAKGYDYDAKSILGAMGDDVAGALRQSINDFTTPAIKKSTADAKGFDKPLIDSSDMIDDITFKVNT
jgi:hypothetical protein